MGVFDPDIHRAGTNHIPFPGDSRQQQRICAVTQDLKDNMEDDSSLEEGGGRDDLGGLAAKGKRRKGAGASTKRVWMVSSQNPAGRTAKTSAVRQDTTEGQEAIRLNSGHALGRAWPQQVRRPNLAVLGRWRVK
ncbi:hypothetical protein NDU88_003462 [Pleurodeles waltl]|uniref:Uncharacterized protein n=1 Tax=Pleurodeles waltl TaxID=8319 RepID=A0AAV7WPG7_PLEWA|nr:hypothetical protein NDU88_003462 [Pleurodeles waltl]